MADWDKISTEGSVDDRRGVPGGLAIGGGLTLMGALLFVGVNYLMGVPVLDSVTQLIGQSSYQQPSESSAQPVDQTYATFAKKVMGSSDEVWSQQFRQIKRTYHTPTLVLFRGGTQSGCGGASSATGPHYCPTDQKIYLDETFFDELTRQLGAKGGDMAQAYVMAHEVGHHVQNQLGEIDAKTAVDSVKVELQADCYAGVWANGVKGQGILDATDLSEAIDAAEAVGDDRIQQKTEGRITPETWTHGSSAQRQQAFMTGYSSGRMSQCAANMLAK
jgi:predicted metalloprotease